MLYDIKDILKENNIKSSIYKKKNGNLKLGIYNFAELKKLHSFFMIIAIYIWKENI